LKTTKNGIVIINFWRKTAISDTVRVYYVTYIHLSTAHNSHCNYTPSAISQPRHKHYNIFHSRVVRHGTCILGRFSKRECDRQTTADYSTSITIYFICTQTPVVPRPNRFTRRTGAIGLIMLLFSL